MPTSRPSPAPVCRSSRRATGIRRTTARSAHAGDRGPRTAWPAARARASRPASRSRPRPWWCRRTRCPSRTPTPGSREATSTRTCARPGCGACSWAASRPTTAFSTPSRTRSRAATPRCCSATRSAPSTYGRTTGARRRRRWSAWAPAGSGVLLTDLYQLTMLQAYVRRGMGESAVFELFVRSLPPARGFLLAAGLEQALEYLETLRFTAEDLAWVAREGRFDPAFVDYLARLRFTGEVHALPEGTVFFADEPILRVTAPLPEAQLVESRLLNLLHFQTLVASRAAPLPRRAPGKLLVDFGMRRAHGAEAALLAARASYLAGLAGSATVLANLRFGIPVYGTMAHSFVQAHDDEAEAFAHFAADDPEHAVHLLDTYHTEEAAAKVVALARAGVAVKGVRLDSGDLAEHARRVRRILDAGGLREVTIFASGNLD